MPFALKAATPARQFVRGPIHLGPLSRPVNVLACMYLLFVCAVAVMPTAFPINKENLNYSPVAYGIFLVVILTFWYPPAAPTPSACPFLHAATMAGSQAAQHP